MSEETAQPTEAEMRAYVEQLRAADPAELLVQAYTMLGTGAEVKLGRPDARVLIDAMAAMVAAVGQRVPGDLAGQLQNGVAQLQTAQVQAEQHLAAQSGGEQPAGSAAQRPAATQQPAGTQQPSGAAQQPAGAQRPAGAEQPSGQRATDRLWIPGRGAPGR